MKLRILKLRPDAKVPTYATEGAACFDLHAVIDNPLWGEALLIGEWMQVRTGLAFEVPQGYALTIRSRSGLAFKHGVTAMHGTVDADFRGEVMVLLHNMGKNDVVISDGDRIAQAMLVAAPRIEFEVAEQLSLTERGANGLGSTGAA